MGPREGGFQTPHYIRAWMQAKEQVKRVISLNSCTYVHNLLSSLVPTTPQPDQLCISPTLSIAIAVSAAVMALFLTVVAFALGVLVGVCRSKTRQASATVSAAQSEAATPAISETVAGVELERVHEYEDIVLPETKDIDTFTSNVAYGCTHLQ